MRNEGKMAQNSLLNEALREEKTIFRQFNSFKELDSGATAFSSPASQEVPHWNMVYPNEAGEPISDLARMQAHEFYPEHRLQGHFLSTDLAGEMLSRETSEYFVFHSLQDGRIPQAPNSFSPVHTTDLETFAQLMGTAFEFSKQTTSYFLAKMHTLAAAVSSEFFNDECSADRLWQKNFQFDEIYQNQSINFHNNSGSPL